MSSDRALSPRCLTASRLSPSPSVSTQASGSVTVGGSISDTATVSGGYSPTGTVTFNLYSNSAGSGTPLVTDANVPLQNGSATSTGYTTTHTGTDYWVATYNGDSNNSSESSGASSEPVSIGKASPSITTTQQPSSAVVGSTVADQATVSGSVDPSSGDTVTFDLYNSATTQNASTLLYSSTVPLGSGGTATSGSYTTKSTGTDYWVSSTAGGEPVTVMTASKLADLSVQIGGPASAADGTSFNETVTVHNAGPATAGYVLSALVVPAGVSVTSTGGGSEVLGVVYWTAAQINANSTVTYTLTFKVAAKVQGADPGRNRLAAEPGPQLRQQRSVHDDPPRVKRHAGEHCPASAEPDPGRQGPRGVSAPSHPSSPRRAPP